MKFFAGRDVGLGTSVVIAVLFGVLAVWFIATGTVWPGIALGAIGVIWLAIALVRRAQSSRPPTNV
jgi:type VI protein secretion system component VasK